MRRFRRRFFILVGQLRTNALVQIAGLLLLVGDHGEQSKSPPASLPSGLSQIDGHRLALRVHDRPTLPISPLWEAVWANRWLTFWGRR